jgi:glycosyltransferase involved in cell wall biosynthesis
MTSAIDASERPRKRGTVFVICPGGLENGGGIGRQMGYFIDAHRARTNAIDYRILDSRGARFLGTSKIYILASCFYLAWCVTYLFFARMLARRALVHINITGRGSTLRKLVVGCTCGLLRLPYVLHVHDYDYAADYGHRGGGLKWAVRTLFRGAEAVIVLGAAARETLIKSLDLSPARIMVLHNAVPDPMHHPCVIQKPDKCELLFLGYLSERKGVPELLHALATAEMKTAAWHATIAGGGPVEHFRHLAESLGIADRVDFPGWLDKKSVADACRQADVLVLPSHAEGLAMAVLEGLSHGLAVVTTPVGAHSEVIEPELSGLLVPAGDAVALAAALLRLIRNPVLRQQLQIGARARYVEKFAIGGYADRLAALHRTVLDRR